MNATIEHLRQRAASRNSRIVFPESDDPRVIEAAEFLEHEHICDVIILHNRETEPEHHLNYINHYKDSSHLDAFSQLLWEKRAHKLENEEQARTLMQKPLFYAAAMVDAGHADGCVAGSVATTAEVIRAALQVIGLKEDRSIASSTFLMAMPRGKTLTYADCGVVPYPDEQQLADIALESARTHRLLTEQTPRVAMLSFSTKGSARHPRSQLVTDALEIAQTTNPDLAIDGELQFDAAFVPSVAKRKAPDSILKGDANVFIFPNLDAGNIAYKITERLAGASATGPILQGLVKPMMDLSRGCNWQDIVNAACVAILMASD